MSTPTVRGSLCLAFVFMLTAACGGGGSDSGPAPSNPTPTAPVPVLTSIGVSGGTSLTVGGTLALLAAPKDQNGNAIAANITWSSSATSVATVNASGLVTGVAVGTAVITAASGSISTQTTVTVQAPAVLTTISVTGGGSVNVGNTLQLTAAPKDQNGNAISAPITWSSSAPGIATVSSTGVVTGVSAGSASITALSGSISGTATVTVVVPLVLTSITVAGTNSIPVNTSTTLTATPRDQNGNAMTAAITWSSSAPSVATVSSTGVVTGISAGTSIISATSGGVTGTLTMTVTTVTRVLTTILVSGGNSVAAGATLQLTASPRDQFGDLFASLITWASSVPGVATVNSSGLVTGVTAGSTTITATSGAVVGSVQFTVTAAPTFPGTATVNATTFNSFNPASVDIAVNGTVSWVFAATHDVTFGTAGAPANIPASNGTTVARTFPTAGVFSYQCTLHPGMTGSVTVH